MHTPQTGESLAPVRSLSTGSSRAVTPSKVVLRTTSTPQRLTTPLRHGSANKERELANITYDSKVINRSSSRSMSRKKQRQWDNKYLFGVEFGRKGATPVDVFEENEDAPMYHQRYAFQVDWRSKFSELFEFSNLQVLESFRTCSEVTIVSSVTSHGSKRKIRVDEWKEAEKAWLNVEKRLRSVIVRSLVNSEQFRQYVEALEAVILSFILTQSLPDHSVIPTALREVLLLPAVVNQEGVAELSLKDSSFHRLLLHGVCQFYGVKSKSVVSKQGNSAIGKNPRKITLIRRPNNASETVLNKVSLVGFLHACIAGDAVHDSTSLVVDGALVGEIEQLLAQTSLHTSGRSDSHALVAPEDVLVSLSPEQAE